MKSPISPLKTPRPKSATTNTISAIITPWDSCNPSERLLGGSGTFDLFAGRFLVGAGVCRTRIAVVVEPESGDCVAFALGLGSGVAVSGWSAPTVRSALVGRTKKANLVGPGVETTLESKPDESCPSDGTSVDVGESGNNGSGTNVSVGITSVGFTMVAVGALGTGVTVLGIVGLGVLVAVGALGVFVAVGCKVLVGVGETTAPVIAAETGH